MDLKIAKKCCFLWNNSFSMRQIEKCPRKNSSKLALQCVCHVKEIFMKLAGPRGPHCLPPPSPTSRGPPQAEAAQVQTLCIYARACFACPASSCEWWCPVRVCHACVVKGCHISLHIELQCYLGVFTNEMN